jgi:hypothetical protein
VSNYQVNLDVLVNHSAALSALTALSAKLSGIGSTVAHLNGTNGIGGWGRLFKSAGLALASAGIITGLVKMVEHSKELNSELARLKNLGGDMAKAVDSGTATVALDRDARGQVAAFDCAGWAVRRYLARHWPWCANPLGRGVG